MTNLAEQFDLGLEVLDGGSYEVGGEKAVWRRSKGHEKAFALHFGRRRFRVTREGNGVAGNPRFHVNGFTQPDGKLLQGRSIPELVRKLHRFGSAIVARLNRIEKRIDARFDRLERSIATVKVLPQPNKGRRVSNKLCTSPAVVTWPQSRFIPSKAGDTEFARVPSHLYSKQGEFADGEFRVLCAMLEMATPKGLVWGEEKLSRLANVHPKDLSHFRTSLQNRALIRRTGDKEGRAIVWELLTHERYGLVYGKPRKPSLRVGTDAAKVGTDATKVGTVPTNKIPITGSDDLRLDPKTSAVRTPLNRGEARGMESGSGNPKFARPVEVFTISDLGNRLHRFIGPAQMIHEARVSGAFWLDVIATEGEMLADLLEQGERIPATELRDGKSRAKFLSKRIKERRQ